MPKDPLTALRMPAELEARVDELAALATAELGRKVSRSEQIRTMIAFADHRGCPPGWVKPTRSRKAG
jgi:acyl-CoA reductase-like NAD-dependent aldehyde dehydrogenase